jgi:hypothetical protein
LFDETAVDATPLFRTLLETVGWPPNALTAKVAGASAMSSF